MSMYEVKCELKYKIDQQEFKPLEECPKPRTIKKMMELKDLQEKEKLSNEQLAKWKFY